MTSSFTGAPSSLREAAHVAADGEFFWSATYAADAACWLAEQGVAIIGGETYRSWPPAWASYRDEWVLAPDRQPGEAWSAFVARGLERAMSEIEPDPDLIYFFGAELEPA